MRVLGGLVFLARLVESDQKNRRTLSRLFTWILLSSKVSSRVESRCVFPLSLAAVSLILWIRDLCHLPSRNFPWAFPLGIPHLPTMKNKPPLAPHIETLLPLACISRALAG